MDQNLKEIFDDLISKYNKKYISKRQVYYSIFIINKISQLYGIKIYPKIFTRLTSTNYSILVLNYSIDTFVEPVIEIWDPVANSGMFVYISTKRTIAVYSELNNNSLSEFVKHL